MSPNVASSRKRAPTGGPSEELEDLVAKAAAPLADVLDDAAAAAASAKRRPWGTDEDERLKELVQLHGIKNWAMIATQLHMRNGKQCRERWRNHLRPELNKGEWTTEEDCDIWRRVQELGTKWAQISEQYMPLRTDNDIKNRWNSIIRKSSHPEGRPWLPEENAAREQVLGSSRTQHRRAERAPARLQRARSSASDAADAAKGGRDAVDPDEEITIEIDSIDSPLPLRKLFGSPMSRPSAAGSRGPGPSTSGLREAISPSRAILEGEISVENFDVEAYLPNSALKQLATVSQLCSPVNASRVVSHRASQSPVPRASSQWFDPDLDVSLSPILTPSLRHVQSRLAAQLADAEQS